MTTIVSPHHAFDWPPNEKPVKVAFAQTTRNCTLEESEQSQVVVAQTDRVFDNKDACVEKGVTVGHDAKAYAQSYEATRDFLRTAFKIK